MASMPLANRVPRPPENGAYLRIRHFLWLLTSYWRSRESFLSWLLLAALIWIQFGNVYISVWRNRWEGSLGNALQQKNGAIVPSLIATYFMLLIVAVGASIFSLFLHQYIELRWRTWLTANYTRRWLDKTSFLSIERAALVDNPDQRVAEDLKLFVTGTLGNAVNFVLAVTSISTFAVILWDFSSPLHLTLGNTTLTIRGDFVWVSFLYMVVGSWVIVLLGKPLIHRTMGQQHYEADFRFLLINIRQNAEQIAFARATGAELQKIRTSFRNIYRNAIQLMFANMGVIGGQALYGDIQSILPLLLVLPRYFSGAISLGMMMQVRAAFAQLTSSLSWFIQAYPSLATLTAVVNRIRSLDDALAEPPASGVAFETRGTALRVTALNLTLPSGSPLLRVADWTIQSGERWAVRGVSGAGKSTLLRALAGLWPNGSGTVLLPEGKQIMFVPQKSYLPLGTLREAVAFPEPPHPYESSAFEAVLDAVRLPGLIAELDLVRQWSIELSPGEQQRLAFARVLLRRPDILFLDEATSALDADTATAMYDALLSALPALTLISIVHADVLMKHHHHLLNVREGVGQAAAGPHAHVEM